MKEKALEELFLQHALTGFENAYKNERFPIFELGELTTAYIIADLYRRMKEYDKAMQWVGFVVMDRSVSLRLKTKALHLKGVITEEKRKAYLYSMFLKNTDMATHRPNKTDVPSRLSSRSFCFSSLSSGSSPSSSSSSSLY